MLSTEVEELRGKIEERERGERGERKDGIILPGIDSITLDTLVRVVSCLCL